MKTRGIPTEAVTIKNVNVVSEEEPLYIERLFLRGSMVEYMRYGKVRETKNIYCRAIFKEENIKEISADLLSIQKISNPFRSIADITRRLK